MRFHSVRPHDRARLGPLTLTAATSPSRTSLRPAPPLPVSGRQSHLRDEENEDFISPEEALDKSRKTLREIEAQWAEAKAAIEKYCAEEMERRNALFKA